MSPIRADRHVSIGFERLPLMRAGGALEHVHRLAAVDHVFNVHEPVARAPWAWRQHLLSHVKRALIIVSMRLKARQFVKGRRNRGRGWD
jgi:hypothetical protein